MFTKKAGMPPELSLPWAKISRNLCLLNPYGNTIAMNLRIVSVGGYVIVVVATVVLVSQKALFAAGLLAMLVQIAAVLLMIWARWSFGWRSFHLDAQPTAGGLVTSGPYRYIRHPVYAAVIYFVWAGVLTHRSTATLALAGLVTLGLWIRMLAEERLVAGLYPEYAGYAARTKRIIPFLV